MFYYRSLSNWRKHQAFMKRCLSILAVGLMPVIFVQAKENCSEAVYAQSQQQRTVTVKGTVTDADGQPAIGANVLVKGTSIGTMTDTNGSFSFEAPADAVLEVSYIGFESQEISLNGRTNLNIVLQVNKRALDEVVVVAYGTQKARAVTGSMSKMDAETLKDQPVSQIGEKLQGKFAGVQVNQANGEPNGGLTIRIRGAASINSSNQPLVVVDGFPSPSGLASISPDEIENVTVLKDAASASLYGSRAANGVILVTTKSAKGVQKPNVSFSGYFGVEIVPKHGIPDLMNAHEFAQFKKEYYEDAAIYEGYTGGVPECYAHPESVGKGTDWFDLLIRRAFNHNYNLGITAGNEKFKTSVNINYNDKEGVVLNTYSNRFAVRANNSYEANEYLTFGLNVSGSYTDTQITEGLGNGRNIIESALLMDPTLKYKNDDGTYPIAYYQPGMFANPNFYLVVRDRKTPTKTMRGTTNAYVDVNIIEGLKYRFSANAELSNTTNKLWVPSYVNGGMFSAPPRPAYGRYGASTNINWLLENTVTYKKTIFKNHNFDILAGYTAQHNHSENARIDASNYPDDEISWIGAAITRNGNSDSGSWGTWTLISYLARLNYDYNGKYLLSLSYRRDGCSRFGSDARWANFPSVSAGWIITDEPFMKRLEKLSYLKLRGSWGEVGNYSIGNYSHIANVVSDNYVFNSSITAGRALSSSMGNPELTWETSRQWDGGIDIGLFNDRIFLVYDFYWKTTDGLLYQIDLPNSSGYANIPSNIGKFRFWGHEFALETKNIVGKFNWSTQINVSIDRNRALKLGTNDTPIGGYANQGDCNRTEVGRHLGEFYGYIYDGVFMTQEEYEKGPKHYSSEVGTVRMKDLNDDNVIDDNDRTFIGDPNPDFTFGITNTFSWKNFDANLLLTGSVGNDIFDRGWESYENIDGCFNVFKYVKDRWRSPENPGKGIVPRTKAGTTELFRYNNTRWIDDGSYLRVKNLTIGYTLPIKQNNFVRSLRIYLSAQNLLTITGYQGMDPEVNTNPDGGAYTGLRQGVDGTGYPVARVYSFGLNLNF